MRPFLPKLLGPCIAKLEGHSLEQQLTNEGIVLGACAILVVAAAGFSQQLACFLGLAKQLNNRHEHVDELAMLRGDIGWKGLPHRGGGCEEPLVEPIGNPLSARSEHAQTCLEA